MIRLPRYTNISQEAVMVVVVIRNREVISAVYAYVSVLSVKGHQKWHTAWPYQLLLHFWAKRSMSVTQIFIKCQSKFFTTNLYVYTWVCIWGKCNSKLYCIFVAYLSPRYAMSAVFAAAGVRLSVRLPVCHVVGLYPA